MTGPVVSVVVGTRDRAASLQRCLASIDADPSTTPAEVIVVDNGSSDGTPAVLDACARAARRPFRALHEPRPGANRARNVGVRAARGTLVLHTDDDTTVRPGWIDAIAAAFAPGVAAVGGRVVPQVTGARPPWMTDDFPFTWVTLYDLGPDPLPMGRIAATGEERFPLGANMAFRADVLAGRDGPYSTRLGHTGTVSMGYDEWEVFDRLVAAGHRIAYAPDAVVDHWVEGERLTLDAVRRSAFQTGFGAARYVHLRGAPLPRLPQRLARAARTYRRAHGLRRHGASGTAAVWAELEAFREAGFHLENLLARFPRLGERVARRLA